MNNFWHESPGPWLSALTYVLGILGLAALLILAG